MTITIMLIIEIILCIMVLFLLINQNKLSSVALNFDNVKLANDESIKQVNKFIDRVLLFELHRRFRDGQKDAMNNIAIIKMLTDSNELSTFLSSIAIRISATMSNSLRKYFYSIHKYTKDDENLITYITQYSIIKLRDIVMDTIVFYENNKDSASINKVSSILSLRVEDELRKSFFMEKQISSIEQK